MHSTRKNYVFDDRTKTATGEQVYFYSGVWVNGAEGTRQINSVTSGKRGPYGI